MSVCQLNNLIEQTSIKLNEHIDSIESLNQWKIQMVSLINTIGDLKLSLTLTLHRLRHICVLRVP